MPVAKQAGAERERRRLTFHQQILLALLSVNALVMLLIGSLFYVEQRAALFKDMDARLTAVAISAREMLPPDYHDRITGPDSVSEEEFQKIVERNNQLCQRLGLEYIWSLLLADGKIVFTSSTSPDKDTSKRKHAMFFEPHSNPELYTNTFATMRATYKGNVDKWGDIRVALVPFQDARGRKYLFGASVRTTEVTRRLREVVWRSFAVGLVGFLFSTAVGLWVARRITRPISRLTDTIRAISTGRTDLRADETGSVEMVMLARHFNLMNRFLQGRITDLEASHIQLATRHDTELRHVSGSLEESEQRYRRLLDFAVDGILMGTSDGVITEANEGMGELFGLPRTEIVNKHISLMPFTAESLKANPLRFDLLHKGEKVVTERTILRKDGSEVIVELHSKKMPDGTLQSIFRDITRRKYAEQELLKSEQRYRNLLNFAVSGFLVCDDQGEILDANECLCEICGLSKAELIGRTIRDLPFSPESLAQFPLRVDLVQSGEMVSSERVVRRRDGSEVIVEMRTKKMPDGLHQSIWNDITRRKQEENALLETRRMLEEAQRLAKLGAWKFDVSTRQLTWTDEVYRIHGLSRDYPIHQLADDVSFAAPEYEPQLREAFLGAVERGVPYDLELEIIRPGGQRVWVRASGRPIFDGDKIVRVDGHLIDITENKQAEDRLLSSQKELSRQNEVLNALLRNLSVGVVMVDAESSVPLVANYAALQLMVFPAVPNEATFSHMGAFSFLAGADRAPLPVERFPIARALRGESIQREEIVVARADGSELTVELFATPIKNEDGSIWAALASFVDISERKRAEQLLQESEERYRKLFDMESDSIFLIDCACLRFIDANLSAEALYGVSREEILRMGPLDLSAEPERTSSIILSSLKAGHSHLRVPFIAHKRKDGSVFPVEIAGRFFTMKDRAVLLVAVRDITEQRKAQELLESWNAALEERVVARTAEVARYAHQLQALTGRLVRAEEDERQRITDVLHEDLQQILVAVRMMLEAALQSVKSSAVRKQLDAVNGMLAQSIRLTRSLVQEIAVPAVREGEIPFAVDWLRTQMQDKFNLSVALSIEEGVKPVSENVYLCLYRAVQELLFNVVKHARVNRVAIHVRPVNDGSCVEIVVRDEGCGFAADAAFLSDKTSKGFGLFSILERLEGLGGHMAITSEVGRGTTATLTAPIRG